MQYWAVARTAPNASPFESVGLAGFETFVSRIRVKVGAQWRTAPLFGCYFFVRMVDRWRVLERTIGVLNAVKFGASPARRPDEESPRCSIAPTRTALPACRPGRCRSRRGARSNGVHTWRLPAARFAASRRSTWE